MSNRYKGAVISATPPTTTGGEEGTASGAWTLEQQMQLQAAGLWPAQPTGPWIEDCFSTYLYTGTGAAQTITNGINLSGKGGLVWIKWRSSVYGSVDHNLYDTSRGVLNRIYSNLTAAETNQANSLTAFNSDGFSLGGTSGTNGSGATYTSWSFRKQPKFFDVVTWTGDSTAGRTIAHNLGSVPGCIIVKCTSFAAGGGWAVYHRSLGNTQTAVLNTTDAAFTYGYWNNTTPTSTVFTLNGDSDVNGTGKTYVAYIFAHDAGGFGLTGTDNVISCGSFSGNTTVTLGYEPQWIMLKRTDAVGNWDMHDVMRGWPVSGDAARLRANLSDAESQTSQIYPNATGFSTLIGAGDYIYIAIRRGPMKVPTSGTSVYNAVSRTGTGSAATITGIGFAPDLLDNQRTTAGSYTGFFDRLRGAGTLLYRALDDPDTTVTGQTTQFNTTMDGFAVGTSTASDSGNNNTVPYIWHCYKRAPSVFDIVCYTGNGTTQNVSHNLGVAPELMIVKGRNATGYDWQTYASPIGNTSRLLLNSTGALASGQPTWNYTTPTSSVFSVGSNSVNNSGTTFVAYLFATCAGVSKVGSYTGTGALQTVNCGFAAGARFVLIKRTDSTGDWYVYDTTRGISSGNDPYLLWNTTGAEVTGTNYVDTDTTGFKVTAAAPADINASGGTYIFLAIA